MFSTNEVFACENSTLYLYQDPNFILMLGNVVTSLSLFERVRGTERATKGEGLINGGREMEGERWKHGSSERQTDMRLKRE